MFWLFLLAVVVLILVSEIGREPNSLKQARMLGLDEDRKED